MKDRVIVEVANATKERNLPTDESFQLWAETVISTLATNPTDQFELSIRLVDEQESSALNQQYRQKQGPTNILSFPCCQELPEDLHFLGDLAICAPVVNREAIEQKKQQQFHWAHITIHGVMHLNGFDHECAEEAILMESLEIKLLASLGIPNPYI